MHNKPFFVSDKSRACSPIEGEKFKCMHEKKFKENWFCFKLVQGSSQQESTVLLLLSLTLLLIPYCHHYYYLQSLTFSSLPSFNPLNPKSDKHLISPYNISPESHVKVMRIKEMITNQRGFWLVNKISLSAP